MSGDDSRKIHFLPDWLTDEQTASLAQHYVEADEHAWRFRVHAYNDAFYILDTHTDELWTVVRRKVRTKRLWKVDGLPTAYLMCNALNKEHPVTKEELSTSQKYMYVHQSKECQSTVDTVASPFVRCGCGIRYRKGLNHTCLS